MSFLLDQKGPKNQGSTEICLISLRISGKISFFFENSSSAPSQQISEWPF
jgi:hypothetical protein